MRFSKYHGTGNDFVLVEDMDDRMSLDRETVAAICDRRFGVGADGLIRIVRGDGSDFVMDYYNSDGRVAEMCGNGIRCLGKFIYDRGLTSSKEIDVETRAGVKHISVDATDGVVESVTVGMGAPDLERRAIPMSGRPDDTFVGQTMEVDGRTFVATALSMGNPHCVLFLDTVEDLRRIDVSRQGPMVEQRVEFPARTNVEFVAYRDGRIHVRVWERGSGETMACGTGACAALVACCLAGLTGRASEVEFPGGVLRVNWGSDGPVRLTGPAVWVFDGELDDHWLGEEAARGAMPADREKPGIKVTSEAGPR